MPAGYGVGGYDGSGTKGGMDSGISASPGEAPENGGGLFSTVKSFVDKVFSGTNQNTQKTQKTIPPSQNFFQKNANMKALLDKGYTISKSGNALYSPYNPNLVSARDRAENLPTGIPEEIAFRGTAASINPETGMMFSGGVKGGALDRLTSSMMTPQRAEQNRSRTAKYGDRSARMKSLGSGERTGNQGAFGFLDLDKDGGIFTSTNPYGTVFGMSNKAIYDPSLPEAYRGIPGTYAFKTGEPQKTSEDRMLANEIMSYVMPGAGIVRGANYLGNAIKDRFGSKAEPETIDSSGVFSSVVPSARPYGSDFLSLPESEKNKFMSGTNPYTEKVTAIPLGEYNPLVGYRPDGSPVYAQDPDAAQYQGVGMQ